MLGFLDFQIQKGLYDELIPLFVNFQMICFLKKKKNDYIY